MTLDEIRVQLHFKDVPTENCGEVDELLDEHIGHFVSRIKELKALERELRALRAACSEGRSGVLPEVRARARGQRMAVRTVLQSRLSALGNQEVALAFCPRDEWPKMFRFFKLYRDARAQLDS